VIAALAVALALAAPRPHILQTPIPFPARRKQEMRAYAMRHYGIGDYHLAQPRVIVEHFTGNESYSATFNTFAPDVPDSELHELPGVCSHFVIDRDGTIHQLVPLGLMCRHTVGLNWTAIGIEHVGKSDAEVLHDRAQLQASLRLTRWLQARFQIATRDVIGHNESLSSPYHRERVARLRTQTHDDFNRADMQVYRRLLG
jgi:N-acetylmuramoyl-L-alanine amidase